MNMQDTQNITTVLCLFHTREHAQEALADLQRSEIPANSISVVGSGSKSPGAAGQPISALQQLDLPERDVRLLSDGVNAGGTIIVVSGPEAYTDTAEDIFGRHRAKQVDEKVIADDTARQPVAAVNAGADAVVPVVEEELLVGKRQVQRGGVRVYSRVVETPVEETVVLEEEHAVIDRHPVNRPVTEADLEKMRIQSVEITETAEVPVVEKSARVVEEVLVSKEGSERTERITDTVRKTEVEVEQIESDETPTKRRGRKKSS
ncbi:MAG: YsnF/AvaK domain-containing protein [Bryobacteraceae bacterium]